MQSLERKIWDKFRIKRHDSLPYMAWAGNRDTLAKFIGENHLNNCAEIGVRRGAYSAKLCEANPDIHLFCIDPWSAYKRTSNQRQDKYFKQCKKRLAGYNVTYIKKKSMDALSDIPDESLDFVYIDGLHDFDNVMMDNICWSKKVKVGGIVSGHDYIPAFREGVIQAVNAYTRAHNISSWYITNRKEEYALIPSYFWIKQKDFF